MKRLLLFFVIFLSGVSLMGCNISVKETPTNSENSQQTNETNKKLIVKVVEGFGKKLQMVSLLAPKDILKKSMEENYSDYVSPALITKWLNDPQNAPGRLTSSPWPDRIEITTIEKLSNDAYEVKGEIIEVTSTEITSGGVAAKRPITLRLKKIKDLWLIDDVTLGAYDVVSSIDYHNADYGFNFTLPKSWNGYTIITESWEGLAIGGTQDGKVIETGPKISIRHPQWTSQNPRQDIPILIFTLNQWNLLQQEKFHIGAAPIGPSELGRNTKYVFALPARYNYAFPTGFEEVETILKGNPLHPTNNN